MKNKEYVPRVGKKPEINVHICGKIIIFLCAPFINVSNWHIFSSYESKWHFITFFKLIPARLGYRDLAILSPILLSQLAIEISFIFQTHPSHFGLSGHGHFIAIFSANMAIEIQAFSAMDQFPSPLGYRDYGHFLPLTQSQPSRLSGFQHISAIFSVSATQAIETRMEDTEKQFTIR